MEHIIIAVNMESADIFSGFSDSYPEFSLPIEHKAFIGPDEIMEFIFTLGPRIVGISRLSCSATSKCEKRN